jgi:methylated-DNA-[protein]-cysteine S-methyltransferase
LTCKEYTRRLEDVLAGDLAPRGLDTKGAREHVARCTRCARAGDKVLSLARALREPETSEDALELSVAVQRERVRLRSAFGRSGRPAVRFDWLTTPVGRVFVGLSDEGVCDVTFDVSNEDGYRRRLAARVSEMWRDRVALESSLTEFDAYFSGARTTFTLGVDLRSVTNFTRQVLDATRGIPFGSVLCYGDVAKRIGAPHASRAVGGALGRNPVPIIVPCHRVVARGGLGGFTGGLETKRALLAIEGHAGSGRLWS